MCDLDARARTACRRYAEAEWELAHLLAAMQQRGRWHEVGCSSVVDYAERCLGMPPAHLFSLLKLASDVERFPRLREAWRVGEIGRTKLREILRVVTPQTESAWLDFARTHTSRELEHKVALRPRRSLHSSIPAQETTPSKEAEPKPHCTQGSDKREETLARESGPYPPSEGSHSTEQPDATSRLPQTESSESLQTTDAAQEVSDGNNKTGKEFPAQVVSPRTDSRSEDEKPSAEPSDMKAERLETGSSSEGPAALPPPRRVRLELTFEPAEWATLEAALDLLRAQGAGKGSNGHRRERLLVAMAQRILARASTRARRRYAVVVEKDASTGAAVYVTDRGYLPVAPLTPAPPEAAPLPAVPHHRFGRDGRKEDSRPQVARVLHPAGPMTEAGENKGEHNIRRRSEGEQPRERPQSRRNRRRRRLPSRTERLVLERAGFACERCGRRRDLQIHHHDRVCHGGNDDPTLLSLLCQTCHRAEHDEEFSTDATFIYGRQRTPHG